MIVLIGIDGLGTSFDHNATHLNKFFNNGHLKYVTANVPTDSAENWGSLITGVVPNKHKLKYEDLNKPYTNKSYPSLFNIILNNKYSKVAAFASWEAIITGMIEKNINMVRYAPKLNESLISRLLMYISHYWLNNPIYDSYLVKKLLLHIQNNGDADFIFIHLVDMDEVGHIYGFNSNNYFKRLKITDEYIKVIIEKIYECANDPLIFITTDHGGLGKKHGGDSDVEKNVFIGSNSDSILDQSINSNMHCSKLILNSLNIKTPEYFDHDPQYSIN